MKFDMTKTSSAEGKSKLERKRETDRKAQRASRAKTKAYIAFLEKQASTFAEAPDGNGKSNALLTQKLKAQWEENQKLRTTLQGINTLIKDVLDQEPEDTPKLIEASTQLSFCDPSGSSIPPYPTSEQSDPQASPPLGEDTTLVCASDGTRDFFTILSQALEFMEILGADLPTPDVEIDEDINIRAVLHGWDSIPEENLDIGWKTMRLIDQGLFWRSGQVERIAVLRVQRAMFLSANNRHISNPRQRPPVYMGPTPLQTSLPSHARLIDYFSWPSIRDYLLLNSICHSPEFVTAQFASDIGFLWPWEVRDVAKRAAPNEPSAARSPNEVRSSYNGTNSGLAFGSGSGRYSFSKEFDEAFCDLDSWYFRNERSAKRFPRSKVSVIGMGICPELLEYRDVFCDGVGVVATGEGNTAGAERQQQVVAGGVE